jgi:hypothetical protein
MSETEPAEQEFVPPVVSRWYRYDWQYAVDISHVSVLQKAALLISITPILISVSSTIFPGLNKLDSIPIPLWLLWGASVAFVMAWALYFYACPKFVREYRDFGQYTLRQHSHRWIVWEFYNNLKSLSGWEGIVRETSPKGLTVEASELPDDLVGRLGSDFVAAPTAKVRVFKPVNIDRDIYLPIHADGKKLVLPMKEGDPALKQKEKELFWILYSQAVKERPIARVVYWILIGVAVLLLAINVIRKIYLVASYLKA